MIIHIIYNILFWLKSVIWFIIVQTLHMVSGAEGCSVTYCTNFNSKPAQTLTFADGSCRLTCNDLMILASDNTTVR